jgi:hypothetical protein
MQSHLKFKIKTMHNKTIHFSINDNEKEELRKKAKQRGISMSKYIRSKLLKNYYNI